MASVETSFLGFESCMKNLFLCLKENDVEVEENAVIEKVKLALAHISFDGSQSSSIKSFYSNWKLRVSVLENRMTIDVRIGAKGALQWFQIDRNSCERIEKPIRKKTELFSDEKKMGLTLNECLDRLEVLALVPYLDDEGSRMKFEEGVKLVNRQECVSFLLNTQKGNAAIVYKTSKGGYKIALYNPEPNFLLGRGHYAKVVSVKKWHKKDGDKALKIPWDFKSNNIKVSAVFKREWMIAQALCEVNGGNVPGFLHPPRKVVEGVLKNALVNRKFGPSLEKLHGSIDRDTMINASRGLFRTLVVKERVQSVILIGGIPYSIFGAVFADIKSENILFDESKKSFVFIDPEGGVILSGENYIDELRRVINFGTPIYKLAEDHFILSNLLSDLEAVKARIDLLIVQIDFNLRKLGLSETNIQLLRKAILNHHFSVIAPIEQSSCKKMNPIDAALMSLGFDDVMIERVHADLLKNQKDLEVNFKEGILTPCRLLVLKELINGVLLGVPKIGQKVQALVVRLLLLDIAATGMCLLEAVSGRYKTFVVDDEDRERWGSLYSLQEVSFNIYTGKKDYMLGLQTDRVKVALRQISDHYNPSFAELLGKMIDRIASNRPLGQKCEKLFNEAFDLKDLPYPDPWMV